MKDNGYIKVDDLVSIYSYRKWYENYYNVDRDNLVRTLFGISLLSLKDEDIEDLKQGKFIYLHIEDEYALVIGSEKECNKINEEIIIEKEAHRF